MYFEKGHLYHIFNRGNNSQKIFFTRENYLFFLKKIRTHVLPHADILAWCLMPNHFHLMVYINNPEVLVADTDRMTSSHPISKAELDTTIEPMTQNTSEGFTRSEALTKQPTKKRTLNDSIGILLRSYGRAIQKQQKTTGSLFQAKTKSTCLTQHHGISPAWFQSEYGAIINTSFPEREYPQVCFNYIHTNPVKDGLVESQTDWEFSSAQEYVGLRNGSLLNFARATEYGLAIT